ncbi:hypothetical protein LIER_06057 [Lithospermum erythrorhizon]|uniref:Uncharacterized protein n=1 Tax=Lithospermum erythrorhizon TaxID=34254 RepID=A0AAV3P4M0_LITER
MKWGDYPSDSKNEDIDLCHMYVEVEDTPEEKAALEVPQTTQGIPQRFTITFTDEDMPEEDGDHKRPLYISGYLCDVKMSKMLVDGGSTVNILPLHTLKLLSILTEDLQQTRVMIQGFNQGGQRAMGKVSIHVVIGELETTSWFHLIDSKTTYNVLPGRPRIHISNIVPSTLHQFLKYCNDGMERTIKVDENPFTTEEAHFSDAKFYQRKKTDIPQPLTQVEKVVSTTLKGFVTRVQGPKIEHGTMNPLAYDLLVKEGYDPTKDAAMSKSVPKVKPHGLNGRTRKFFEATIAYSHQKNDVIDAPPGLGEQVKATIDELKEVKLGTAEHPRPTYVSALLTLAEEAEYIALLAAFRDVFAWTYTEMPRLYPKMEVHHLTVKKSAS